MKVILLAVLIVLSSSYNDFKIKRFTSDSLSDTDRFYGIKAYCFPYKSKDPFHVYVKSYSWYNYVLYWGWSSESEASDSQINIHTSSTLKAKKVSESSYLNYDYDYRYQYEYELSPSSLSYPSYMCFYVTNDNYWYVNVYTSGYLLLILIVFLKEIL